MFKKHLLTLFCCLLTFTLFNGLVMAQSDTLWTKTYGGSGSDVGRGVSQANDGGYVITGWTSSFGAGNDVYLIKTNSLGDTVWTKTYGGPGDDIGRSVQQTIDGGYIIAGYTESFGAGDRDVYLIKTDAVGDTIWTRTYGGISGDEGYSVIQTFPDSGYIIAGHETSFGGGGADAWLIKTDPQGNFLWETIWSTSAGEWDRSVLQTVDGGYVMTGSTFSAGPNESDIFLIKTDSSGTILWTKFYGGGGINHGGTVQLTSDGGYIIAGWTDNPPTFGGIDIYLIKTDSLGNSLWEKNYGGIGEDASQGYSLLQQTFDGGYILTGYTESFGAGGRDVYVVRTDSLGDTLWTQTYGGVGDDEGWSIRQTPGGEFILAGNTESYGAGMQDVWLVRLGEKNPSIKSIADIPNDQGKQVRVSWFQSSFDGVGGSSTVVEYSLWRRIDLVPEILNLVGFGDLADHRPGSNTERDVKKTSKEFTDLAGSFPPGEWDFIMTVPAIGSETYNVVAPTLADSTVATGMHWSVFAVIAHTADPLIYFVSQPDSGYSLDNLVPQAPQGFIAVAGDSSIELIWEMVPDPDFDYYALYRSTQSGFDPDTLDPYATLIDTFYADWQVDPNTQYFYRVSAFDFSGNEGDFSTEVNAIIVGITDSYSSLPREFALFQNYPNPFNPVTFIRYAIPKREKVEIIIYNTLGQKVRTLLLKDQDPGYYTAVWDATNDFGHEVSSGLYFYGIKAGKYNAIKKMVLLR